MQTGLCLLRLSPRDFWALTPREFAVMTGGSRANVEALGRSGLAALMQAFPDG